MRVETRTLPTAGQEGASTGRRRRSKRISAALVGTVILVGVAIGVMRSDGGSDGSPRPAPATFDVEATETPVVPFTPLPPSSGSGVSSADG